MRAADPVRSDQELVGLMLRCGDFDLEVLPIVIPPLPPRAKPSVTLGSLRGTRTYEGSAAPPGSAILLPSEAAANAKESWFGSPELEIGILHDGTTIKGVVALDGISTAVGTLTAACATR
ncbi:hypothetical protein [Rhodoplanes roseus]|uniref:Uncharacterized protein n=1 Tax=Rhodoplanes roseus TaxID=29409 RepID=A0A327KZT0_9BRAD|nr:hypothetical protein [Rhodoplanes roseus]RAI43667.1 hypothetical protein CH341_13175 [Rhodoplanes roseus]